MDGEQTKSVRGARRGRIVRTRGGMRVALPLGLPRNLVPSGDGDAVVVDLVVAGGGRGGEGRGQRRGGRRGGSRGGARVHSVSVVQPRPSVSRVQPRPSVSEGLILETLDDMPEGTPLERPLVPPHKRRRVWQPSPVASGSAEPSPGPSTEPQPPAILPSVSGTGGTGAAHLNAPPLPVQSPVASQSLLAMPGPSVQPPSPAMFVECGGSAASTPTTAAHDRSHSHHREPLRNQEILALLHYGSDPESGESDGENDGEETRPVMLPRSLALLVEEDEEEVVATPDINFVVEDGDENGLQLNPVDMYSFDWRPFSAPTHPEERRENFSVTDCGPTVSVVDPYEIFTLIWDRSFMDRIASETNRYVQQVAETSMADGTLRQKSRLCYWKDTNADELYVYFAVILAMGVVVKSKLESYWGVNADIFSTPGFSACMSLRRFQLLNRFLHFNNSEDMYGLNLNASEAKLFKIEPVLTHLNEKFSTLYTLHQNIALDESLLQWKGWLDISQLIPNKKARIGIKSYAICESETGYLWRIVIHSHKVPTTSATPSDPVTGTTPALVLKLVHGLEHKGYTLWMDNYYNSPALARKLKTIGFDCVGTIRTNRQFVPVELTNLTKGNMRPGQIAGFTSGDVDLLVWRDKNRVAMISTYHGNGVSNDESGVEKPIVVRDYNICMGGVDRKDQILAMYPIERKRTKVWYKKLFCHLLNSSVLNAYILHRKSPQPGPKLTHRDFRENLIRALISQHQGTITLSQNTPLVAGPRNVPDARVHYPAEYPIPAGGTVHNRPRRLCTICRKRTPWYCAGCNKPACVASCYRSIHS